MIMDRRVYRTNREGVRSPDRDQGDVKFNSYEHKDVDKGLWAEVWINCIFTRWLLNVRP